jgi:phage terminase Nu1 subunit (DNA packaging protein)
MAGQAFPISVIAKLLLISERRVQQLVAEGHLPKAERGRYELVPCVQAYVRYLRDRAVVSDGTGGGDDKARLAKAKADIAEMEAQRLRGELLSVAEVRSSVQQLTTVVKVRCLSIASKAAPLVALEAGVDQCHEIIAGFVDEALSELAAAEVDGGAADGGADPGLPAGDGTAAETDGVGVG